MNQYGRYEGYFAVIMMVLSTVYYIGTFIYVWIIVDYSPVKLLGLNIPWWLFMFVIVPIVIHIGWYIISAILTFVYMVIERLIGGKRYYDDRW